MAQTFSSVSKRPIIEDYNVQNKLEHARSARFYEMSARNNRVFQLRYQEENGSRVRVFEQEVTHIIGSGRRARSYLNLSETRELTQLPVSWYTQEKQWGMSPGYDQPKHYDFSRVIDRGCLACHNAYPRGRQDQDRFASRSIYQSPLPEGIDCQRCHGPGQLHINLASKSSPISEIRSAIVNPKRLSPELQMDVCRQCHLETTSSKLPHALRRFGRGDYSFKPGERLSDHVIHFDHAPGAGKEDKFEINSSAYRLEQATCFLKSKERMTCTTCHDPHGAEDRQKSRRDSCLQCHSPHQEAGRQDCASCHMPPRRAEDAVLVVITDHKIRRLPPAKDQTAPLMETADRYKGGLIFYRSTIPNPVNENLYMGLALVADGADVTRGLTLLQRAIAIKGIRSPIEVLAGRAAALANENRVQEAIRAYTQVIQKEPGLAALRADYAKVLEKSGQVVAARREYQKALKDDSTLPSAQLGLGRLEKDIGVATELFRQASQSFITRADAFNNLGNIQISQQRFSAARESLERALSIEPDFAEAENNLGRVFAGEGNLAQALKHVERAVKLDVSYLDARYNYARLLHATGDRKSAIAEYREVIAHRPSLPDAHLGLGVALAEEGNIGEAIQELREVLRLRPGDLDAKRNLDLAREIESMQGRRR